jgi:hypothetical protein
VSRGDGIRGSKDLRAGLRKYLRPTNERKKMSKKTIKQHIALVAASALTAGFLSVVSAPVANASVAYASGTTGGLSGVIVGSGAICSVNAEDGTALTLAATTTATAATNLTSMVIPLGSKISMLSSDAGDIVYASGSARLEDLSAATVSAGGTKFTSDANADSFFIVAATVGTGAVANYGTTTAALSKITITVVATCASTVWSDTYSSWEIDTAVDGTPDSTESDYKYVDEDYALGSFVGKDAYNNILPLGTWVVSATNGHIVDGDGSILTAPGTISVDTWAADGTDVYIAVGQPTTGAATSTTVTLSYNGVKVWEKALTWTGDAASITVSGVDVQDATSGGLTGLYDVVVKDAAGNQIVETVEGDAAYYTRDVTSVTGGSTSTSTATVAATTWACRTGFSGSVPVRIKLTNNALATIYSNVFDARCGNAAYTYTASLDKAVYNPGDLATLTITAKDSSGNAPFKGETVHATSTSTPAISGLGMTAITTPTSADTFNSPVGQKIYTFTVGNTAVGKFNMAVDLGFSNSAAIAIPYEIKGDGSVSNADVLKSIVSLIASINKQIQALQKLILKR